MIIIKNGDIKERLTNSKMAELLLCILVSLIIIALPSINNAFLAHSTMSSKTIFFIRGLAALFGFWLMYLFFVKKDGSKIKISKIDLALLVLLLYIVLNRYVIQGRYGFSLRFIELVGLCFFYLVIRTLSKKTLLWFFLVLVVSAIIQGVYGNLQLLGYYPSNHVRFKMTGNFFNPGPYAGFLATIWPIALGMYLFRARLIKLISVSVNVPSKLSMTTKYTFEYIPLLGVVLVVMVLPATQSRASWLAVLTGSFFLMELRYRFIKKATRKLDGVKKKWLLSGLLFVVALTLLGIYNLKKESSDGRLFVWKVSVEMIKKSPVFGLGFDRFKTDYMNYQANYFNKHGETKEALVADNSYYAFNEFIQFTVENGILGFTLLTIVLIAVFRTPTEKHQLHISLIAKISLITVGVFASFSYPMEILPIKLAMVFFLAVIAILDSKKIALLENNAAMFYSPIFKISMVVLTIMAVAFSINFSNDLYVGFKKWKQALNSYQYGDYEGAIETYDELYPMLKNHGDFLMNYGKVLSISNHNKKAIEVLEQAKNHLNTTIVETALGDAYKGVKQYKKAELAYKHAADMIPSRFYPLYLLAKLYQDSGDNARALGLAKRILKKDIKVPSTAIKEIQMEMKKIISQNNDK